MSSILLNGKNVELRILESVISSILDKIRELSEFESVAIRLERESDFPYYVHEGFHELFINKESSLNVVDEDGEILLDADESPYLECMCGNILKKRTNRNFSFYTEKGSFWTNSTSKLLRELTEEERQEVGKTRNTCHNFGYESVALIPIPIDDENVGLIQLNDPREDMFTIDMIKEYEFMGEQLGLVIKKVSEVNEQISFLSDLIFKIEKKIE